MGCIVFVFSVFHTLILFFQKTLDFHLYNQRCVVKRPSDVDPSTFSLFSPTAAGPTEFIGWCNVSAVEGYERGRLRSVKIRRVNHVWGAMEKNRAGGWMITWSGGPQNKGLIHSCNIDEDTDVDTDPEEEEVEKDLIARCERAMRGSIRPFSAFRLQVWVFYVWEFWKKFQKNVDF